ncbi:PilZ domain-containing protein [Sphingobium nicotianae]|uniref:PilZ domain-containing protein n=1 Tax=Sphingobium nicotianae TaxID=2782607 RepID=A0A9X1AJY3_9SPHN|nr:PilZ domain-containing protein [Sphingobium nicotianae]MBT2185874.1 PilZ domain-containing protein [Sphingobium nicotianae]
MAESDPTPILQDPSDGASKRGAKRDSLFLLTTLSDETGNPLGKARVRNLSETGLMADCEASFRDGDRVVVQLRGIGDVSGRVSWVRGDRIGMAFDARIDPQAARKPVSQPQGEGLPLYLRQLPRVAKFSR